MSFADPEKMVESRILGERASWEVDVEAVNVGEGFEERAREANVVGETNGGETGTDGDEEVDEERRNVNRLPMPRAVKSDCGKVGGVGREESPKEGTPVDDVDVEVTERKSEGDGGERRGWGSEGRRHATEDQGEALEVLQRS